MCLLARAFKLWARRVLDIPTFILLSRLPFASFSLVCVGVGVGSGLVSDITKKNRQGLTAPIKAAAMKGESYEPD